MVPKILRHSERKLACMLQLNEAPGIKFSCRVEQRVLVHDGKFQTCSIVFENFTVDQADFPYITINFSITVSTISGNFEIIKTATLNNSNNYTGLV